MKPFDARHFWKWFMRNNQTLLHLSDLEKNEIEFWDTEMLMHAKAVCPKGVEIDIIVDEDDSHASLILTSSGDQRYFKEIELLAEESPHIECWDIYALYPPMVMDFKIDHLFKDTGIDPDELYFNPEETEKAEGECHLTVWSGDEVDISAQYAKAVKRVLLNLLGERLFAREITSFTVRLIKEASEQTCNGLFPLELLPGWVADNLFSAYEVSKQGLIVPRIQ